MERKTPYALSAFSPTFATLVSSIIRDWPFDSPSQIQEGRKYPPVNVWWENASLILNMALAGWKKEDIEVYIEQNELVIQSRDGYTSKQDRLQDYERLRHEISLAPFKRVFRLPLEILDTTTSISNFVDGMLCITIQAKQKELPPRLTLSPK